jgi:signal transduction histidine kinase
VKDVNARKVGFVLADLEVGHLLKESLLSTDFDQNEYPLLIEHDHDRLAFHPTRSLVGEKVERALPGFAVAFSATNLERGAFQYETGGEEWLALYANLEEVRWTFALLSPLSPAIVAVRRAGLLNLGIILAAVFIALALSPIIIGRITGSIRRVTEGAEAIAGGDLNQQISVASHDETQTLAEAFNRMAGSLRGTLGDLRKLNEELEVRVEERTAQLEQANRHKSEFLASMSHDLRTPMNAIIGYTRILLRRTRDALDDRQYQNLENIQTSADNLLRLINDILDLSRIEAGRIDVVAEEVDFKQLVHECLTSVRPLVKPEVKLEKQMQDVAAVRTDGDLLRKVVMNLVGNAVKFTERGSITVSLKPVDGWIELSVADTGPGIPAEDLPHIFEEFRQVEREGGASQEGTGLGLSIAKKSIELLGGTISADSEVGAGTTFALRIRDYQPQAG